MNPKHLNWSQFEIFNDMSMITFESPLIDPNYTEEKLPVTLSPRLVQDRFAVRRAVDNQVRNSENTENYSFT